MIRQRHQLISSKILMIKEFWNLTGTTGHTQPLNGIQLSQGYATEQLWGDSLLLTTQFPGGPRAHLIGLRRMKGWVKLGATQQVWKVDPWIPNRPMTHEVVVLDTTFLWRKKLKILNGSFQWYSWSKNPTGLELTFEKKFAKVLCLCFTPAKVVLHSPRGHWNPFSITLVVEITQNIPSVLIFRVQSQYCIAICKNTISCRRAN